MTKIVIDVSSVHHSPSLCSSFPNRETKKDMGGQTDILPHRQTVIPAVDGGVGEEGQVGGELAPEPEDRRKKRDTSLDKNIRQLSC